MLEVRDLVVRYGEATALRSVSLSIEPGRVLGVLGANGAGKSSLAAAIAGRVPAAGGSVHVDGRDVTRLDAAAISRRGLAYVPEDRALFPNLTVLENLQVRLRYAVPRRERRAAIERAIELFPVLGERRGQAAGTLSGGEQQMLSLARVLAAPPRLLVADEMSLGLAPRLVDVVFTALDMAKQEGVTVLLVEQYVERALAFADEALILRRGAVAWRGDAREAGDQLVAGYLGPEA